MADASATSFTDGFGSGAWILGIPQIGQNTGKILPGATQPASLKNESVGGLDAPGIDDDMSAETEDLFVSTYGLFSTAACGNYGPSPASVASPGFAPDVMCVGAYNPGQLSASSDDFIDTYSSIGPTAAGRKKPDLVAVGEGMGANANWQSSGSLWNAVSGTSFSSPQVAGAGALLMGSGISDPLVIKAILLDSARQGRSSPSAAMGTQSGWQPDWGWGALDLTAAFAQRTNFYAAAIQPGDAHFFSSTTSAAGDRATLVWNRRVDGSIDHTITPRPLTNLNLFEYDAATGAARTSSTSAIDNVEQTRTAGAASVIFKITAGAISGASAEPYALAATRQITPLVSPRPHVVLAVDHALLGRGDTATATVTATNASPDLDAAAATLGLAADSNAVVIAPLDPPPGSGLTKGQTITRRFLISQTGDGVARLTTTATDAAYGSTLTATATQTVRADVSGPATTLSVPSPLTAGPFTLSWSASDPSGVRSHEAELSIDDAPFAPLAAGTATSAEVLGAAGHRYRLRVRATDALGNVSTWHLSPEIVVPVEPTSPPIQYDEPLTTPPSQPVPPRAHADGTRLTLNELRLRKAALTFRVSSEPAVGGSARVAFSARLAGRRISSAARATFQQGVATVRLPLPRGRWTDGRLIVATSGTPRTTLTRRLSVRGGRPALR